MRVSTDLIGNPDLIGNADSSRDLAFVLHWPLGTLSVLLVMALRTSGVSRLSLSLTLTITIPSMSVGHYLRVMSNNSRAVMNLLRCFLAVLCDNILTLLHISSVHHHVILLVTSLVIVSLASSV